MKRIILTSICVFAIDSAIASNLFQQEKNISLTDLASNTIEALASGESISKRCTAPKTNKNYECRNTGSRRNLSSC